MHKQKSAAFSLALLVLSSVVPVAAQKSSHIPTPSEFLGFEVGADRKLADYRQISAYFKALSAASDHVQIQVLGKTTLGEEMFMAVISTPENLRNKAKYQEMARKLADPRGLSKDQIDALASEGKAIFLLTCNIHSTEIGSSQMAMEWPTNSPQPLILKRCAVSMTVIILLVPSLNPDGETMVTEWFANISALNMKAAPCRISTTTMSGMTTIVTGTCSPRLKPGT